MGYRRVCGSDSEQQFIRCGQYRVTRARMIVNVSEAHFGTRRSSSSTIARHFGNLDDPRIDRTKRHLLSDILTIAICAVICDADGWVDVENYGVSKQALCGGCAPHGSFFVGPPLFRAKMTTSFSCQNAACQIRPDRVSSLYLLSERCVDENPNPEMGQ
jgi:hypothetical protein